MSKTSEDTIADLIQAIRANPGDDNLRLILADAYEEIGDPRAQLIHAELALANGKESNQKLTQKRAAELRNSSLLLLDKHNKEWAKPLYDANATAISWENGKGFPARARMPTHTFCSSGAIFANYPPMELILSTSAPMDMQELANCPHLGLLGKLGLSSCGINNADAYILASSPHVGNLTKLDASNNPMSNFGGQSLADSRNFTSLIDIVLPHAAQRSFVSRLAARRAEHPENMTAFPNLATVNRCPLSYFPQFAQELQRVGRQNRQGHLR